MLVNRDITDAAQRWLKAATVSERRKEYVQGLLDKYVEACEMSVMNPDDDRVANRRAYYHEQAAHWRLNLCAAINYHERRPCRGEECCA
jgi:hypothetical protein